ncbi:MAG: LysM peptidoglycan-binding protein [Marmoricola sp.]|nr:LysM peptidoglycan-binding protein [Marmoricola sp.]
MSTLSISPAFVSSSVRMPRVAAAPTVKLTQRGRVVVVLAFLAIALVVMMSLSGWATASRDGGTPEPTRTIEVQPGDTLYGIAGTIASPGHIRDMVQHIEQLNSLTGASLTVGQKIAIPLH